MGKLIRFPNQRQTRKVPEWSVLLEVKMPADVVKHPSLTSLVEEKIGRFCLTDLAYENGIRTAYNVEGTNITEAHSLSRNIALGVTGFLGLDPAAIVKHKVVNAEELESRLLQSQPKQLIRHLQPVPDDIL